MKEGSKHRLQFMLSIFLLIFLYFYGANRIPFINRTDSRYAEIAREMVISGNYLVPTLMGTPHLHKPPLAYWFIALGLKLFGLNEFGARFFLIIFSLLSIVLVYLITREISGEKTAILAMNLYALTPAIFLTSRILATDMFLLCFQLLSFYSFIKFNKTGKWFWPYIFWVSLAFGFLTKGPVAIVIPLLIILFYSILSKQPSEISPFFKLKYIALFSIIAFPWYLYLILSDSKVLKYFVVDQLYARIAGVQGLKIGHPKPFYFYFEILPVLILPFYIPFLVSIWQKIRKGISNRDILLFCWFSIPLIFFSFILTKLPTYILFSIPPAAIITSGFLTEKENTLNKILLIIGLSPLLFLINIRSSRLTPTATKSIMEVSIIAMALIAILLTLIFATRNYFKYAFVSAWVIIYISLINVFIYSPEVLNTNKKLSKLTKSIAKNNYYIVSFRQYAFQIPFYTNRIPYYCDVKLEKEVHPFTNIISCNILKSKWNTHNFLVLTSRKDLSDLAKIVGDCFVLAKKGNVFVVSSKPIIGTKIYWKTGIQTHTFPILKKILKFIKVPFNTAKEKALKSIKKGFLLHDNELAILKNRLFYEFEFVKGNEFKEILVDASNSKVYTDGKMEWEPQFTEREVAKIIRIKPDEAEKTALKIIKGNILEREIEIENGVLCLSFHILKDYTEFEILINALNGLPFKVSVERIPGEKQKTPAIASDN